MVRFGARWMCGGVWLAAGLVTWPALSRVELCGVPRALAQAELAPPPEYDAEVGAAVDEHEAGRYEAARAHFQRAHQVFPNARTLRGLGKVEFELRNYVSALRYLEEALTSQARPLSDDLRLEVRGLIERARDFVGELVVDVQPTTALIAIDGGAGTAGPRARFVLPQGAHVLDVQASGRLAQRRRIEVHGRDQLQLTVELLTIEPPAPTVKLEELPVLPPPERDVPLRKKWWVWTASGVALAGATTAAVLLATRDREHKLAVPPGADWTLPNP